MKNVLSEVLLVCGKIVFRWFW